MPRLVRNPAGRYGSQGDERAFFEWIERIPCIERFWGSGPALYLQVPRRRISDACLRELLALFRRYDIDMSQLAQFENASNRRWFRNPAAYWYKAVFGKAVRTQGNRARRRRGDTV
jgi:hypothetical protein